MEMLVFYGILLALVAAVFLAGYQLYQARQALEENAENEEHFRNVLEPLKIDLKQGQFRSPDALRNYYLQRISEQAAEVFFSKNSCWMTFMEELRDYFDEVTPAYRSRNTHRMLARKGDALVLIQVDTKMSHWDGIKSAPKDAIHYLDDQGLLQLSPTEEGDPKVLEVIHSVYMVYPIQTEEEIKATIIQDILERSKVEFHTPEHEATIRTIYGSGNWFSTSTDPIPDGSETGQENWKNLIPDLTANYMPVHVEYKAKLKEVPMDRAFPLMAMWLLGGANLSFGGDYGTGKTYLMRQLVATIAEHENVRVYSINKEIFKMLMTPAFQANASSIFNPKYRNVLFMDQAESILTDENTRGQWAEFLDGQFQKRYNLCTLFCYHGEAADYREDLFRKGRVINFHFRKLDARRAEKVASYLEKNIPSKGMIFDRRQMAAIQKENEGLIRLSDVYACVTNDYGDMFNAVDEEVEELIHGKKPAEKKVVKIQDQQPTNKTPNKRRRKRNRLK